MKEPQETSAEVTRSQSDKPTTYRLVIRAKILPDVPDPAPVRRHTSKRALALVLAAVAVLVLGWVGFRAFRTDPTPTQAAIDARHENSSLPAAVPASGEVAPVINVEPTAAASSAKAQAMPTQSAMGSAPDSSPSAVNELTPDVPRSALQTIRGTIRVSVRVVIDRNGTVVAASPEDRGPSRYFEHLATEAAKKWTFTPMDTAEPRTALVRFNFTRAGATAHMSK